MDTPVMLIHAAAPRAHSKRLPVQSNRMEMDTARNRMRRDYARGRAKMVMLLLMDTP